MKRLLAAVITLLVMGVLLWRGLQRGPGSGPGDGSSSSTSTSASTSASDEPGTTSFGSETGAETALRGLMSSAQAGDVAGYLAAFAEPMKSRLTREVEERGRDAFAADLRAASAARKSHAVFAPEPDGPGAVRIIVESIYADRNERQTYRLAQTEGAWLITDVETARAHTPTARFGTPAEFQAPEGVPVQGAQAADTMPGNPPASTTGR